MRNLTAMVLTMLLSMQLAARQTAPEKGTGKITGKVVDTGTAAVLEYATITIFNNATGKILTGTTSDVAGKFTIGALAAGNYKVVVEFIGYKPFEIPALQVKKNETVILKTVQLAQDTRNLAGITVTGQTKLIENKIDKLVFNAEKDLTSQGGVATDLLKKVPQVSVDVDGNVQLAGNSSIRFLINGKPSTTFGSNISEVLQSIPASQIRNIEVITNPGARYDAQGLGGIININLKQTTVKGINGNLSLSAGTRTENGSFNFNARNNNFGFNAFVSGGSRLAVGTPYTNQRHSIDAASQTNTVLAQDGNTRLKRHGVESGIGIDWAYKKYNNFSASVNYNVFGNSNDGLINQSQVTTDADGNTGPNVLNLNKTGVTNRFHNVDAAFNYKRSFKREDQELEFAVNTSMERSTQEANNEQQALPAGGVYYGIQNSNPGKQREIQAALDYTQPLVKQVTLGTGLKATFLDINSSSAVFSFQPGDKLYQYDSSLSNQLNYHQHVYAAYAELSFPIAKLLDVKVGSRYERTEINSDYSNAQQPVKTPGYNTLVPSVFLSRKLGENQLLKLSYSKRIERPDYGDLNPFINTSDPKNVTAGNPYLLPELGHRIELGYSRDINTIGSFMISAFYQHNGQDIQPYVRYYPSLAIGDSLYYNVSVSSRENIGTEHNAGINLFTDLHPGSKLGVRVNLFMFHRSIVNEVDAGGNRTSFNYRTSLNATYQFSPVLAAEFFGNFNSARNEVQGKYPSLTTYSFAFRKQLWNRKASLALTATNPFNEYITQRQELYGPGFIATNIRKVPFRSVGLNFTWKFGLLEFKKEKQREGSSDLNILP